MNTEHTKHPCEAVEANADVMKLAEMILSDCGYSTAISDSLQRRVAGRIQLYVDNTTQQLQGQVGALLAAMDVIALGELPDGKYANISTMVYAEEACKAAKRAPIKDSLTADRQPEPVAWAGYTVMDANADKQGDWPERLIRQRVFSDGPDKPGYGQEWVPLVELQPASAQQQAEPVAREFFAYDPECGFETFRTEVEAKKYAQDSIDSYREEASEGWPELVNNICWGVVLGTAQEVELLDDYDGCNGLAGYMKPVDYVLTDAAKPPAQQQAQPRCACGDSFTSEAVCANCLAAQPQAEPVALIMCDGKSYDFMVTVEGQKRIPDTGEFVHLYAAQPPAVAVPEGWPQQVFELCNDMMGHLPMTEAMMACMYKSTGDRGKYPNAADWLARAALSAAQKGGEA